MPGTPSIHYRRRWFYVLWVGLLLLSAGAWRLWEKPLRMEEASLALSVRVRNAPPGAVAQVWAGPAAQWPGLAWSGPALAEAGLRPDGLVPLPLLRIRIGRRRWLKGYVPRDTWDLVMIKLTAPGQPARYFIDPLSQDIRMGVLKPGWRLSYDAVVTWGNLRTDGRVPEMP